MFTKVLIAAAALAVQNTNAAWQDTQWWDLTTSKEEIGWFKSETYLNFTKEQKMDELWSMIVPDPNVVEEPAPYKYAAFPDFFTLDASGSFCQFGDEQQYRRVKASHTQGVVAKAEWVPYENDLGYTGIYEEGSDHVLVRLSETSNLTNESTGLHPGLGIKFLRDGTFSENIVATPNLIGSDSWDYFHEPMKTRVEGFNPETHPIEVATKQKKMVEASSRPFATAVGTIGKTFMNGEELPADSIHFPYELQFVSPHAGSFSDEKQYDENGNQVMFYDQLKTIRAGQILFEVYAMTAPTALDGQLVKIADLVLSTDLYTSQFGDERLHFQHVRVWNDVQNWPVSWRQYHDDVHIEQTPENTWGTTVPAAWPEDEETAQDFYLEQIIHYDCPFAWLLQ